MYKNEKTHGLGIEQINCRFIGDNVFCNKYPLFKSKKGFIFYFIQEVEIILEETEDDHVLTDQTPVKMEPTLSYDNEPCTLDWTSSADEVRQPYMFFFI